LRKSLVTALAIVGCAALVAGCSSIVGKGDEPSKHPSRSVSHGPGNATIAPRDLGRKVGAAMRSATRFHLVGNVTDAGKPLSLDIHFAPRKAAGWIKVNGEKIELIRPGGASLYFRLPRTMWKRLAGEQAAVIFSGKWVKVPVNDKRFATLAHDFDAKAFTGDMSDQISSGLKKVGPATVGGVRATEYKPASGKGRVLIAQYGPPVILKVVEPSRHGSETIRFSDYGKAYEFRSPPATLVIDLAKLAAS
jgi:hypothetical protein